MCFSSFDFALYYYTCLCYKEICGSNLGASYMEATRRESIDVLCNPCVSAFFIQCSKYIVSVSITGVSKYQI